MTTLRQAAQQALEALNRSDYLGWQFNIPVIKALRAALAEPESPAFPEGYEPHELPADYTGKLWIEGQVARLHDLATRQKP